MKNDVDNFTVERVAELRKNIDFSDIPEIKDFSSGYLQSTKNTQKKQHPEKECCFVFSLVAYFLV